MKIGFDAKRFFCNQTGLGNYARTLLLGLSNVYDQDEYHLFSTKLLRDKNTEYAYQKENIFLHTPNGGVQAYWRSFSIKKDLKKENVSLYHGLSNELPFGIEKTGIASVVTIHDIIYKTFPAMFPFVDRQIYDLKFRNACKHAQKVVAISESTKNDIVNMYQTHPDKVDVIYQGVNPLFYSPISTQQAEQMLEAFHLPSCFALYVGSINERKNLLGIVEAYKILSKDKRPPLVVIGDGGGYKKKVLDRIRQYGMEKEFIFLNNVKDLKFLQAFYTRAKMLLFPSFYEGFGLPVCEAALSRTAVLTSEISSLPEAGGPQAFYVNPYRVESIAEKISEILTYDETSLLERCVQTDEYVRDKFEFGKILEHYHRVYENLS